MARYWWATFKDRSPSFVFGEGETAARAAAAAMGAVVDLKTLPYPSADSPDGTPAFCHSPAQCAGRTACPQRYSCTE